jgi:hypothetical protein
MRDDRVGRIAGAVGRSVRLVSRCAAQHRAHAAGQPQRTQFQQRAGGQWIASGHACSTTWYVASVLPSVLGGHDHLVLHARSTTVETSKRCNEALKRCPKS